MKLNLGSGNKLWKGWVNLDMVDIAKPDVVHDLDKFPYPFKDNTFKKMVASNVMEHLHHPNQFLKELWRIGKHGCEIEIITPHFGTWECWEDITHIRPFAYRSLQHLDIKRDTDEDRFVNPEGIKFEIDVKITFGKLYTFLGISYLANKFPMIYENLFNYIFQPRKLIYNLKVVKEIKE